jgi:hypothetical protein
MRYWLVHIAALLNKDKTGDGRVPLATSRARFPRSTTVEHASTVRNGLTADFRCVCARPVPKTTVCERPLQCQKRGFLEGYRMVAVPGLDAFSAVLYIHAPKIGRPS